MKKINYLLFLIFILLFFYSIINAQLVSKITLEKIVVFLKVIVPSLLPFLLLNKLIIDIGIIDLIGYFLQYISYPLFKISGKGASVILISFLCGFPSSVLFTTLLLKEKQIEKEEAQRIINAIFLPSFSFLFIVIKNNLNNNYLFSLLILSLYLGSLFILYFSSLKVKNNYSFLTINETTNIIKNKINNFKLIKNLKTAIKSSFDTLINIIGIIIFLSIPSLLVSNLFKNKALIIEGLLEFSLPSIKAIKNINNKKEMLFILNTFLSFSSLSSLLQANLFINESSLSFKSFFKSRILNVFVTNLILLSLLYL